MPSGAIAEVRDRFDPDTRCVLNLARALLQRAWNGPDVDDLLVLEAEQIMRRELNRPSARQRGYTWRWEKCSRLHRQREPLCRMCQAQGVIRQAELVDHIIPHKGDQALFWDEDNWQSLCHKHHNATKKAQEARGYSSEVGKDGWPLDQNHPANKKSA